MKKIKFCMFISFMLMAVAISTAQIPFNQLQNDFAKLSGIWQGSLTYLDYSSGKPYTMPANIEIKRIGKSNQFIFSNIYPNELSANSIDTVTISKDGRYIDKEIIKSRRKLESGDIEIVTEESGTDGNENKSAIFRHTYTFGSSSFKKRKDVQFTGETEWINRHEYSYKK